MSKEKKQQTLVPRLRFPEFRTGPTWEEKPLGDLADPITERVGDSDCIPFTITTGEGLISQDEKYGRTIAGKSLKNYYRLERDDFAFNKSATKAFPQGYIARFQGDERAAVPNSIFTCFRIVDESVDAAYLDYLFQGNLHGRWLKNYITVGARAHGALNISDDDLFALPVPLPAGDETLAEQQKIANCLGSLDDLIASEGRKLAALRDHKKGLMQKLFPREGETRPRLRAPEFQNAGQWANKLFEALYDIKPNNTYSRDQLNYAEGTVKNIHYGDIHTRYPTHFRVGEENVPYVNPDVPPNDVNPDAYCRPGDLIFADASEDLADVGKCIEIIEVGDERVLSGSHTILARPRSSSIAVGFAGYLFKSRRLREGIEKEAQGTKVMQISPKRLAKIDVLFPRDENEQQRITDCFASLDALVAAQAAKLDVLRTHKRGLMQQLFPSPVDVEA